MSTDQPRVGDTITTADEVRRLPYGTVVRTHSRILCEADGVGLVTPDWYAQGRMLEAQHLPATILYVPDGRPRPSTDDTRPAEDEATDLDRLYSTLNLQGIWNMSIPPGGSVCPWCGDPWESEPSCEHAEAIYQHDNRVMAFALEQAADALREDPSAERGSVKQRYNAVYAAWLRERAARLRGGEQS